MTRILPMMVSFSLTAVWCLAGDTVPSRARDASAGTSRRAHVTMRDGTCQDVVLEGVGCPVAICSRVAIRSRAAADTSVRQTSFDEISAVEGIRGSEAVFVMKNGSKQRRSVIVDNRVLYVTAPDGHRQKIDLGNLESLTFLPESTAGKQ